MVLALHCCDHLKGCDLKQLVRSLKSFQSFEPVWVRDNAVQHLPFLLFALPVLVWALISNVVFPPSETEVATHQLVLELL